MNLAEIGTPSSLASFPVASSSSGSKHIRLGPVYNTDGAQVVAAVQGSAVWVYDAESQQAITSFTVPSSTTFHSPPLSYHPLVKNKDADVDMEGESSTKKGKRRQRYTAVAVAKSEGVGKKDEKKVVWVWKGEEEFEQVTLTLEHEIDHLIHIKDQNALLAASSSHLTIISPYLTTSTLPIPSPPSGRLIKIFTLSRKAYTDTVPVALVYSKGDVIFVGVNGVNEEISELGDAGMAGRGLSGGVLRAGEEIEDAFLDEMSMIVHLLTSTGRILPEALSLTTSSTSPTTSYTFNSTLSSLPLLSPLPSTSGPLFLHATSSNPSSPQPTLIVLQPSYPAVLTQRTITTSTKLQVESILPLVGSGLTAVVSSTKAEAGATGGRWLIHTVDVTVPEGEVGIAGLLSSGAVTDRFITTENAAAREAIASVPDDIAGGNQADQQMLTSLRQALFSASNLDAAPAEQIWKAWNEKEGYPFKRSGKPSVKKAQSGGRSKGILAGEVIALVFEAALGTDVAATNGATKLTAGTVDDAVWETKVAKGPYLSGVVGELLKGKWVDEEMWAEGGVLKALATLGDWDNVSLALTAMPTVRSNSLLKLLQKVMRENAAQKTPTLSAFLEKYIAVQVSSALHRRAVKEVLRDVGDIQTVLEELVGWLVEAKAETAKGLVKWTEEGIAVAEQKRDTANVIRHIQLILDAHLPLLLSNPPSYPTLQTLNAALKPLTAAQTELVYASSIVEAFRRTVKVESSITTKRHGKSEKARRAAAQRDGVSAKDRAMRSRQGQWLDPLYTVDEVVL